MEKIIPNFENYTVNDSGNNDKTVLNTATGKYKKPQKYKNGYLFVTLYNNRNYKAFLLHRLVAQAFIQNPENKQQVGHWDCNRSNNKIENLYWCTAKENMENEITRKNISESRKGKEFSEEHKKHLSETAKTKVGELNNFYGHKHTDDYKTKSSERMKKKLAENSVKRKLLIDAGVKGRSKNFKPKNQINLQTGEIIKTWNDYIEFSKSEYDSKCVRRCCNGKRKSYKGFGWEYI